MTNPNLSLINTSVDDCAISMSNAADRSPVSALESGATLLHYMNENGITRLSHRKVIGRAMRKAIKLLEDATTRDSVSS